LRIEVLKKLAEPRSCPEVAKSWGDVPEDLLHVKILESAGLIEKVEEHGVRGIMEGSVSRGRGVARRPRGQGRGRPVPAIS
jgi:hypothetical protein